MTNKNVDTVLVNKSEYEQTLQYREQCALLLWGKQLAETNKKTNWRYNNFIPLEGGAATAASQMIARQGVQDLFQLTPDQMSLLVPRIRLFKSFFSKRVDDPLFDPTEFEDVEFIFGDAYYEEGINSIVEDVPYTGEVGIKDFSCVFDGGDPAQKYFASCDFSLSFLHIEDLYAPQFPNGPDGHMLRFIDLIPAEKLYDNAGNYNPEAYVIKAVLGWATPNDPNNLIPQDLKDAIDSFSLVMNLNLIDYEIDMSQDGSFEFNLQYRGTLDSLLLSPLTDILADEDVIKAQSKLFQAKQQISEFEADIEKSYQTVLEETNHRIDLSSKVGPSFLNSDGEYTLERVLVETVRNPDDFQEIESALKQFSGEEQFINVLEERGRGEALYQALRDIIKSKRRKNNLLIGGGGVEDLEKQLSVARVAQYRRILERILANGRVFYFDVDQDFLGTFGRLELINDILGGLGPTNNYAVSSHEQQMLQWEEARRKVLKQGAQMVGQPKSLTSNAPLEGVLNSIEELGTIHAYRERSGIDVPDIDDDIENREASEGGLIDSMIFDYTGEAASSLVYKQFEETLELGNLLKAQKQVEQATFENDQIQKGKERIIYFYLGDLIDAALTTLTANRGGIWESIRVLLGSIQLFSGEVQYQINLADLPISFDLFTNWFAETVVKKQKKRYLFRDFIKDVINLLIPTAAKSLCFTDEVVGLADVDITNFTVKGDSSGNDVFSKFTNNIGRVRPNDPGFREALQRVRKEGYKKNAKLYNHLFINCSALTSGDLQGEEQNDFKKGIYHFYLGNEKGFIKRAKFKKNADPNIRAANLQRANQDPNAESLTDLYDLEVTMIGNSLFYPGQIFYVNPLLLGLGNPKRRFNLVSKRRLPIGGYYIIMKVENILKPDHYETIVTSKFHSFPGIENRSDAWVREKPEEAGAV